MAEKLAKRESYNPLLKSFPDSEKINAVSEGAEVLYLRLIAASDDAGRYWAEPKMVLGKLFTHRALSGTVTAKAVEGRLAELEKIGLIEFYTSGGRRYLQMVKVFKRLRADIALNLFCPQPDDGGPPLATIDQVRKALTSMRPAEPKAADGPSSLRRRTVDGPTSLRRRPEVGPTSVRSRAANPTQPYPTQPNPTASAAAAGVAAPNGAAHPDDIAASKPSLRGDCFVVVSDGLTPTEGAEAAPNHAARDGVASSPLATDIDAPRDAESRSSSAEGPAAAGPPATAPPPAEPPDFETFWAAFPPRNGRKAGDALAKCYFEELDPNDKRLCLEAVRNYAHEARAGKRIPKDGDGFLRADYWRAWIGPPAVERSTKYIDPNSEEAQEWSAD